MHGRVNNKKKAPSTYLSILQINQQYGLFTAGLMRLFKKYERFEDGRFEIPGVQVALGLKRHLFTPPAKRKKTIVT